MRKKGSLSSNVCSYSHYKSGATSPLKRYGSVKKVDENLVKMEDAFKNIIQPNLLVEMNKNDLATQNEMEIEEKRKRREQRKMERKRQEDEKNEENSTPPKVKMLLEKLPKFHDNLDNKYEAYMKKVKKHSENPVILKNVSEHLMKINNFKPQNQEMIKLIKEIQLKKIEDIEKREMFLKNKASRNKTSSQFFTTSQEFISKNDQVGSNLQRTKSEFFNKNDQVNSNFQRTKSEFFDKNDQAHHQQTKSEFFDNNSLTKTKGSSEVFSKTQQSFMKPKRKITEAYLDRKYTTNFKLTPKDDFVGNLNREINSTNALLMESNSKEKGYMEKERCYFRKRLVFDNYKDDFISNELKMDLLAEMLIRKEKEAGALFKLDVVVNK